ncbi:MAG: hypothetical protein ACO3JL_19060 [Myxococcota bacterium]
MASLRLPILGWPFARTGVTQQEGAVSFRSLRASFFLGSPFLRRDAALGDLTLRRGWL